MDVFRWIEEKLEPRSCDTVELVYDDMDSQSGRCLPIIYQPFDVRDRAHWRDRGALYDFATSARSEGARLLDFGPGDGWPSLIVAPLAGEVVGVDGSGKRVEVCTENARRLGIGNVTFTFAAPGEALPLADETFDGAMAASSVEQTPDPLSTLRELRRVLRPGGRLRLHYEALGRYVGGRERDLWLQELDEGRSRLLLYDRDVGRERVLQYGLTFAKPLPELAAGISDEVGSRAGATRLTMAQVTAEGLDRVAASCTDAVVCTTLHPSGETLASWLLEAGFSEVLPTHSGAQAAGALHDKLAEDDSPDDAWPLDVQGVDALVRPLAQIVCQLPAPLAKDPMLTAIR